uniref:L1 transposable element RRM domain-containing protein n=1 Tax=Latimeria chalumnae TaxID=7897 RepID=H3A9T6_LATCH
MLPNSDFNKMAALLTVKYTGNMPEDIKTIMELLTQITSTVSKLLSSIEDIKETNENILSRMLDMEQRVSDAEDGLLKTDSQLEDLKRQITILRDRIDDQENRGRRNNLRLLGFPEGLEQNNLIKFLDETLPQILGLPETTSLDIEQAHRSLGPRPTAGQRPRPFIIKLLHYQTRELLLKAAWDMKSPTWEGQKILIFPDISKNLQEKCKLFLPIKKQLQLRGIKYGIFYPATLKITYQGTTESFTSPEEAAKYAAGEGGLNSIIGNID